MLLVVLGPVVPGSIRAILAPERLLNRGAVITNRALLANVIGELVVLVLLGLVLRARGWTLARLGLRPAWLDPALALPLAVACYAGYWILWFGVVSFWPGLMQTTATIATHLVGSDLRWPSVVLVSMVNPVFEEVFLCAYLIAALRERIGVTAAINVSAALRVFGHFYQGALGVLSIVPMGLLFAYWFARTGRLWPLILAHAVIDFVALAASIR